MKKQNTYIGKAKIIRLAFFALLFIVLVAILIYALSLLDNAQPGLSVNDDDNPELVTVPILYIQISVPLVLVIMVGSICLSARSCRRMKLFKEKFRIATSQSARAAFEYNLRTDKLVFISNSEHVKLPKPSITLTELGTAVHPTDRPVFYQSVADLRSIGTTSVTVRIFNFSGKEEYRWYHVTGTRLTDRGEGKALTIGTVEDIDEQETERLALHQKATLDSLTGLWNRSEIEKEIRARLSRLNTDQYSAFSIMDLDGFKAINDKFGHDCGDKALIYFAETLRKTFRFGDILGRLGGDEFVVYMPLSAEKEVIERRLGELADNLVKGSGHLECGISSVSCSTGCCIASKGDTFESIYKRADDALYESKTRGKMQFTIVE